MGLTRTKIERWAFTGALTLQMGVFSGGLSVGQSVAKAGTAALFLSAPLWLVFAAFQLPETVAYLRKTWRTSVPRVASLTALMTGSAWLIQRHSKHAHLEKAARLELAFWGALAGTFLCLLVSVALAYRDFRRSHNGSYSEKSASQV